MIIHLLPAWTWQTDANYRLTHMQASVEKANGLKPEDLLGFRILLDEYEHQNGEGSDDYLNALRNRAVIENCCYERVLMNGRVSVLMDNAVPIFGDDGAFQGYHGVSIDLTTVFGRAEHASSLVASLHQRAQTLENTLSKRNEELKSANDLLVGILQAMGEGVMVTSGTEASDPDNRILLVNPAYKQLFELSDKDIYVGMSVPEYHSMLSDRVKSEPTEIAWDSLSDQLKTGKKLQMQVPGLGKYYSVKASPGPSGGYVLVHSDVTDLQARNAALASARDAAEAATKTKSSFLATMSHEIRTPMNGVVGMAELLSETELTAEQADYVATIRNAGLALTSLISDILDFSKIEAGHMDLNPEPFELREMIHQTVDLLHPLANGKGLAFNVSFAPEVPQVVNLDALRLRQVLLNFLGNAVKFTLKGEVSLRIGLRRGLWFQVRDTGIGMSQEDLPKLFSAFEQVHDGKAREFEGTGLGLAISKQLISAMKGVVEVRSELGKGTTFDIFIPFDDSPEATKALPVVACEKRDLAGFHVLLVEDNATNQLVVRKLLERQGIRVTVAENGQVALNLFAMGRFDTVLMDISMPVMTGLEATRIIRSREVRHKWPRCPIIALTGNAFERDRADALAAGMDDFLTKPVQLASLLACLSRHIPESADSLKTPAQ